MGHAVERRKATREVTFRLTDEELLEKGRKAADLRLARTAIQEEFLRVKSTFKGRLEEKENELSTTLALIREGVEKRVADVIDVFRFDDAVVETYLHDRDVDSTTAEPIETRQMTADERQMGFKFKKHDKNQPELPLPATEPAKSPATMGDPEPWRTDLPMPEHDGQEAYVTGEPDRPTMVRYLALTWRLEAGEGALFKVKTEEIFGNPALVWVKDMGSAPAVTAPAPEEPPAVEPERPAIVQAPASEEPTPA